MKIAFILAAFLAAPLAHAKIAVYKGELNGAPITLTFDVQEQTPVKAHYIACADANDNPCDGAGQYAFFAKPGQSTITFGSEAGSAPVLLALYLGEEDTLQGKLNGEYNFMDRTSAAIKVNGITFNEQASLQNKIQTTVSSLAIEDFKFPASYTLLWDNHDDEAVRQIDSGSVTLVLQPAL